MEPDKLQSLYNNIKDTYDLPTYDVFKNDMGDPVKSQKLYQSLVADKYELPDYDTFTSDLGLKKKSSPLESASKGETIVQGFGQQPKESLTQPQPSESVSPEPEPPKAKTFGEWVTGAAGVFNKATADIFDKLDYVQTLTEDAFTTAILGKETANARRKMIQEGVIAPTIGGSNVRPFEAASDLLRLASKNAKDLPTGKGFKGFMGNIVSGGVSIAPQIAATMLLPEVATGQTLTNLGIKSLSKFGMVMGAEGAISAAKAHENGTTVEKLSAPMLSGAEGYMQGFMYDALGEMSSKLGGKLAEKLVPVVKTEAQAINKAGVQAGTSVLSNALAFGGLGTAQELLETGNTSWNTFGVNAGLGLAMGAKDVGKVLWAKGMNSFISAPKVLLDRVSKGELDSKALTDKANEHIQKIENGTSVDRDADLAVAAFNQNLAQLNEMVEQIQSNKEQVVQSVKESTLETPVKKLIIDKINELDADNDPKIQASKGYTEEISKIDDKLGDIRSNESLSDVEKELRSAPLKEQKEALKNKIIEVYNNPPKEVPTRLSLGGQTFKNKEELNKYLDEVALDDKGEINKDWFDRSIDEWPNEATSKAVDEWANGIKQKTKVPESAVASAEEGDKVRKEFERAEKEKMIADLKESEKASPEEIAQKKTTFIETKDGRDYYNVVLPDGQRDTFNVPQGSSEDVVTTQRDEILTKFGGQDNASKSGEGNQPKPTEGTSELEQGKGAVNNVGNNEQKRTAQEEVTPTYYTKEEENLPKGIADQLKTYSEKGVLKEGWGEATKSVPKKLIRTLPDGTKVFAVDGTYVRDKIDGDWTEGGNPAAYPNFTPKDEIWVESVENGKDQMSDLIHEFTERNEMQKNGTSYSDAHEIALKAEDKFRETGEIPKELQEKPNNVASIHPTPVGINPVKLAEETKPITWYHGSRSTDDITKNKIDPISYADEGSLVGLGFYTTSDPAIAKKYAGQKGRVFRFKFNPEKLINGDAPISKEIIDIYKKYFNDENPEVEWGTVIDDILKKNGMISLVDFHNAILEEAANDGITKSSITELFQDVMTDMNSLGYDGITHEGGKTLNQKTRHRVLVLFDPDNIYKNKEGVVTAEKEEYKPAEETPQPENAISTEENGQKAPISEQTPESGTTPPKEPPVSEVPPTTSETGENGNPPENTQNEPLISGENKEIGDPRERTLLLRYRNAKNITPEFKEDLDKNVNYTYNRIPNTVTQADVDYLIGKRGIDEVEKIVYKPTSPIPPRVRMLAGVRIVKSLGELANEAKSNGDAKSEAQYRMRKVDMAQYLSEEALEMGRGIQILGAREVMAELDPIDQVIMAKREIRKQRDSQIDYFKKDIDKKAKSMRDANNESVDEVLKSKIYDKARSGITGKQRTVNLTPDVKVAPDKIKETQDYIKSQWDRFKKASGGSLSLSAVGLNAEQIESLGNIIGGYMKLGYYKTEKLVAKLTDDLKKHFDVDLSEDEAKKILALPDLKINGKTVSEIQIEGEHADSSTKLANRVGRMLKDPKVPIDDPVKQMVETLFKKVEENDTKEKVKTARKSDVDKLKEAIDNKKEYASVWEEAKDLVKTKIDSDKGLSDTQKADYNERLDGFYNEVIGQPFAEKQVEGAVKGEIKDLGISIDKIIREHYTVYDATKRTLQEKLVDELGLSGEDAKMISDAVGKEFDKIAIAKKRAILQRGITPREAVRSTKAKQVWEKLIEDSNLGAFSDSEFAEAYADKWGFPKLTDEQTKEIERLSDKIYKAPEGSQKYEAIQDLLAYQAKLPGIDKGQLGMSIWYNFILSGFRTQWKNISQNTINATMELAVSAINNPANFPGLVVGAMKGTERGVYEAGHILKTGYNPIRGSKIEGPSTTELTDNKLAGLTKYVTRWMVAADMFTYSGLKEMRAYELALNMAREQNADATEPTMSTWKKASETLYNTAEREKEANVQADQEGLKGNAKKRRVWEIMEQGRGAEMIEDAANFASRGTFNHATEGALGLITDAINIVIQKTTIKSKNPLTGKTITTMPIKYLIPFTRIVTNVANVALDYYPPMGYIRAARGKMGTESMGSKYREYTKEERRKLVIKASIGLASQVALYLLSHSKDEDGNPLIEITANGYGSMQYEKNNELKARGWQPYSIRIGKKWYSYQYTPLVLAVAPIGFLNDMEKYQPDKVDQKSLMNLYTLASLKSISTFNDMTAVSSLNSLSAAFKSGDVNSMGSYLSNLGTSTVKGFVYPKLAEQTVQTIDAMQGNPRKEAQGFLGKITKDLPIVRGKYGFDYKPMLNAVGEPVPVDAIQSVSTVKHEPFWDFVDKHNITIGKPTAKTPVYDDVNKVERGMTDNEYYDFIKKSGQEIRHRIETEVMPKDMSEDDIKKAIDNIKTDTRNKYKTELFGWGQLRKDHTDDWTLIKDNDALQVPKSSVEITIGKEKTRLGEKDNVPSPELEEFNNDAMEEYRKRIVHYLNNKEAVQRDKLNIDKEKGKSKFDIKITDMWSGKDGAVDKAQDKATKRIKAQKTQ